MKNFMAYMYCLYVYCNCNNNKWIRLVKILKNSIDYMYCLQICCNNNNDRLTELIKESIKNSMTCMHCIHICCGCNNDRWIELVEESMKNSMAYICPLQVYSSSWCQFVCDRRLRQLLFTLYFYAVCSTCKCTLSIKYFRGSFFK